MGFKRFLLASALCVFVYLANSQSLKPRVEDRENEETNTQKSKSEANHGISFRDLSRMANIYPSIYTYGFPYSSAPGGFYRDGLDMYTGTNAIPFSFWRIGEQECFE